MFLRTSENATMSLHMNNWAKVYIGDIISLYVSPLTSILQRIAIPKGSKILAYTMSPFEKYSILLFHTCIERQLNKVNILLCVKYFLLLKLHQNLTSPPTRPSPPPPPPPLHCNMFISLTKFVSSLCTTIRSFLREIIQPCPSFSLHFKYTFVMC